MVYKCIYKLDAIKLQRLCPEVHNCEKYLFLNNFNYGWEYRREEHVSHFSHHSFSVSLVYLYVRR